MTAVLVLLWFAASGGWATWVAIYLLIERFGHRK